MEFGVVGARQSSDSTLSPTIAGIGVSWIRHYGIRWDEIEPTEGALGDVRSSQRGAEMLALGANFNIQCQIFTTPPPAWAVEASPIYHNGDSLKPSIQSGKVGAFAAHVASSLPEFTYFKVHNELDRDATPAWLDNYAMQVEEAYDAIKAVRPDAVVAIEGGFTPDIVDELILRGVYDHADEIDHHLYDPTTAKALEVGEKVARMGSYSQPIIATEMSPVSGSGSPLVSREELAASLVQVIATFFGVGGERFMHFVLGHFANPGANHNLDVNFENVWLLDRSDSRTLVGEAYSTLQKYIAGSSVVDAQLTPGTPEWYVTFEHPNGDRAHVVWTEDALDSRQMAIDLLGDRPVHIYDPSGREWYMRIENNQAEFAASHKPLILHEGEV